MTPADPRTADREAANQRSFRRLLVSLQASLNQLVRLQQAQSDRERFFFSLQWTREALREFQFPIVLWLTEKIAAELALQAPDFWSWRGGVFEFEQPLEISAPSEQVSIEEMEETDARPAFPILNLKSQILELQLQIAELESPGSRVTVVAQLV